LMSLRQGKFTGITICHGQRRAGTVISMYDVRMYRIS